MVTLGSGDYTYEVLVNWESLPPDYSWREVAGVVTDNNGNVYVFNRGDHPMIVFDKDGNFLRSWGEDVFIRAHGVTLGPDDTLYCTDDGDHTVRQCTLDGKILMTLGVPGQPAPAFSGMPFNRCTHVALHPESGDLYVSDGYANSRVHRYSPDGKLLYSWGEPGVGEGEFNITHNIATDKDGYVYVADRENHRIQVFDENGKFETMYATVHRPCAIYITEAQELIVGELGYGMAVNQELPNIGPRVTVMSTKGEILARVGDKGYGEQVGQFMAPHGVCVDPAGDIYVGEVAYTNMTNYLGSPPDRPVRSFQKLKKI